MLSPSFIDMVHYRHCLDIKNIRIPITDTLLKVNNNHINVIQLYELLRQYYIKYTRI